MDPEQEGSRKKRSAVYAVLRLTQAIFDGFNSGEATAAVFVDLKGAFNRVWRDGLIYKLHKMGVNGRMLKWIQNFLTDRTARCHILNTAGPQFSTKVGLPQDSVLSPVLFNIFTKDMYESCQGDHCEYVDVATVWSTNRDPINAVRTMCRKVGGSVDWCKLWRMSVNFLKTEGTVFTWEEIDRKF